MKRRDGVRSFGIGNRDFGPPSASSGVFKVSHMVVLIASIAQHV